MSFVVRIIEIETGAIEREVRCSSTSLRHAQQTRDGVEINMSDKYRTEIWTRKGNKWVQVDEEKS